MSVQIKTNNVPRDILDGWELSPEERQEFDYINWDAIERGEDSCSFVRFKGELYDLNDTEGTFPMDRRWFYISDSFFSGVLFRYAGEDCEQVICATYYVKD